MIYQCCTQQRITAVAERGERNGIAFLAVSDSDAPSNALRQRTLFLRLLLAPAGGLTEDNIVIDGGVRYPAVAVEWAAPGDALPAGEDPALLADVDDPHLTLVVRTAGTGDYSRYRLRIIDPATGEPPDEFDQQLAEIEFSFKVQCPNDFDCDQPCTCRPAIASAPPINYLAKDFDSLRQMMLDRIALLAPDQDTGHAADLSVALVEMLAYVGDHLSYRQDAIATEAYLGTARSRISLRRHARLVDYPISEGCNARVFTQISVTTGPVRLAAHTQLLTTAPNLPAVVDPHDPRLPAVLAAGTVAVFETVDDAVLDESLARLAFWTWGERDCCLPAGATSATLTGHHATLRAGDVLILTEEISPTTGSKADADPTHRAAVRLIDIATSTDKSGGLFNDPPDDTAVEITEITWDAQDALTFPLCLSANTLNGYAPVAIALGNIVLADHGRTIDSQTLGPVPGPTLQYAAARTDACAGSTATAVLVRFRPQLAARPLTFAHSDPPALAEIAQTSLPAQVIPDLTDLKFKPNVSSWLTGLSLNFSETVHLQGLPGDWSVSDGASVLRLTIHNVNNTPTLVVTGRPAPASSTLRVDPAAAAPAIQLTQTPPSAADLPVPWSPLPDLLSCDSTDTNFVVEIDTDATAVLRFGDNTNGMAPPQDATFAASYRIGNGTTGNIGAWAISHIVANPATSGVLGATNPMAALGGTDPDTPLTIRRDAPQAYQVQERAVTQADYASVATRIDGVAAAVAEFRWTGSWYTAFVTPERAGGGSVDSDFSSVVLTGLDRYRMAGYDLAITAPIFVAINIDLFVCVLPSYLPADVEQQLLDRLGSAVAADGTPAMFNPANWTFGRPVYLSAIYAAAQEIPGVQSVTVRRFQRRFDDLGTGLADGVLPMGAFEIAQCANDANYPDRGVLTVTTGGGR
ncbi:MAG: hypothetical protein QOC63_1037 [Mycobacterium sp.]|nr:hypothetical protein [Mycobacterium sp.]